ncbi:MAG TPA: hypothetical protein DF613_11250, partial [Lachnospiraceae bacterium]|nr:hypothetical protein [Lachnospiraceae bacterium]
MGRKNRFRWGLGLLAAGILTCGMPLAALAAEGTMMGAENTSEFSAGSRANDTDKSDGLVFEWLAEVPTVETVFTAGGGTAVWTPELQDGKVVSGTLVLIDAVINNSRGMGINFPVPVDIKVEGSNQITSTSTGIYLADRATGNPLDLKIAGSGSLEIRSQGSGVQAAGNIVIDTVRLDVVYGSSSAVDCHGLLTVGGDIEIENSKYVKVKSNAAGIGNNGGAIYAGQNRGQTVRIVNSHVIAITGEGSAIDANSGKIELVSSDVRAIGKAGDGSRITGTLAYFDGCTMDGGTLFAQNNGADLEIPSTPDAPLRASNSAVLYGTKTGGLPLEGDLIWYLECSYDENADEITQMGRGYVFGDVIWNGNMAFGGSITIGYVEKEASLTIPQGFTLNIPDGCWFSVGNSKQQSSNRLINNGNIAVKEGGEINIFPNSTVINNGTINVQSSGGIYNYFDKSSQTGGLFQNSGAMNVLAG